MPCAKGGRELLRRERGREGRRQEREGKANESARGWEQERELIVGRQFDPLGGGQGALPLQHGRGDGATHPAAPDQWRDGAGAGPAGCPVRDIHIPNLRLGKVIKVPTWDFR